jgi:hypothetical protein
MLRGVASEKTTDEISGMISGGINDEMLEERRSAFGSK